MVFSLVIFLHFKTSLPAGMYIDHEDRIYVVEQLTRRVQIFQYISGKWKQRQKEVEKNVGENGAE
jgi:hypothetical protein